MLHWEKRHPYNALHAVYLRGPSDPDTLREAIQKVCRDTGIGILEIDRRKARYAYRPHDTVQPIRLSPAEHFDVLVQNVAEDSMNEQFPEGPHHPIRWYVGDIPSDNAHAVIVVYHHVAADAAGIEALLADTLCQARSGKETPTPLRITLESSETSADDQRPLRRYGILRSYARTFALSWRVLWSRRPRPESRGDDRTGLALRTAPDGLFMRLKRRCAECGIGVNDMFIAALAKTLSSQRRHTFSRLRRPRIVLGTVISRRSKWKPDAPEFFGVRLSDAVLLVDRPEDSLEEVARRVVEQTKACKSQLLVADAVSDMRLFLAKWSWPIIRNSRQSFRRFFPVCGGVSTVFVSRERFGAASERIERYVRACPPGPAMPIVLAPTIWGSHLEFTLVYRLSSMDSSAAGRILEGILAALEDFAGPDHSTFAEDDDDTRYSTRYGSAPKTVYADRLD
jgi:hypothetical protein